MKALVLLAALVSAQPMLAQDVVPSDADVAALVGVIEARGCVLKDKNDETVLTESKLSQDLAHAVVQKLIDEGKAAIVDDELHLMTGACPAAAPALDRAAFVALVEANGCKLSGDEADKVLRPAGFTPDNTNTIVQSLMEEGLATVQDGVFTLKTGNCH